MPLTDAVLDHVAVAVDDLDAALAHWHGLGAVPVSGSREGAFATEQVRMGNGAKVELLGRVPDAAAGFVDAFLAKFGSGRIHHVTLKVRGPLQAALRTLADDGVETVDFSEELPYWHEAFVRPSIVGGMVAQIAWSAHSDAEWARHAGRDQPPPLDPAAPAVLAVRLTHTDPAVAAGLWSTLGATIEAANPAGGFTARWPDSPLVLRVAPGEASGPVGLEVDGAAPAARTDVAPALLEPVGR